MFLGELTIQQTDEAHVSRDFIHNTAVLHFKNSKVVDALIRDLQYLRENMRAMEEADE